MKKQLILSIVASSLLTTFAFGVCSASIEMGTDNDITLSGAGKIISGKQILHLEVGLTKSL
jgi:hypothetical protein